MLKKIESINTKIALLGTKWFGNIWTFYIFFAWGLLGLVPFFSVDFKNIVMLVSSSWIQLFSLPLLAVGASVLNKSTETRAKQDHESIRKELQEIQKMHREMLMMMKLMEQDDSYEKEIIEKLDLVVSKLG